MKGDVLLRREISVKVICEKFKFSNSGVCNNFRDNVTMDGHSY